jgi:malonyl-CoA/methylmalonyl-CoA synthetase
VPHPDFGETVVAVCIPKDDNRPTTIVEQQLTKELKGKLAGYKRPKKIIWVDE